MLPLCNWLAGPSQAEVKWVRVHDFPSRDRLQGRCKEPAPGLCASWEYAEAPDGSCFSPRLCVPKDHSSHRGVCSLHLAL